MKKIAILGATGYIGKSLTYELFNQEDPVTLFLFSRTKDKLERNIQDIPQRHQVILCDWVLFTKQNYDVVINCTGIRDPAASKKDPIDIYSITEEIDNYIIAYCIKNPKTVYINISSGAVYGNINGVPVSEDSTTILHMNALALSDHYTIAKINAEAKHRALSHLSIVDVRVFSFFSRFINTSVPFLMSDIVDSLQHGKVLQTNTNDIVRDYISPHDLFYLIQCILKQGPINDFYDVYSLTPVSKFELLSFLNKTYGLHYQIVESKKAITITKNSYYSTNKKAALIGYVPKYSSLSGIQNELNKMELL